LLPTRACLLLCLVLVAPHAAFATTPAKDAAERPIAADPGIHYRVLPNGMRYWIRPDAPPEGKVSLWLRVDSGSLNEDDDQRGIAHLLEHLAFNGSANFPAGTLIRRFEAAGLTFGAHQNATTSYTDTTYKLTVPNDPKLLDLSLLYFADVAFRLTLDPEEVERERAVVEAERRARNNAATRAFNRRIAALAPGSRLIERLPIGAPEVVRHATAEQVRAYYEKWYRPENTTLLVAGDVDPGLLDALVRKHFGEWRAEGAPPAGHAPGIRMYERERAEVIVEAGLTRAELNVAFLEPPADIATPGAYRESLVHTLGQRMFNWRMQELVLEGAAPFTSASISAYTSFGTNLIEARAKGAPEDWEAVTRSLLTEVKRARVHGFSASEFAHARQVVRGECAQQAIDSANLSAEKWLDRMDYALGRDRRPLDPGALHALCVKLLPEITQAEVEEALRTRYAPGKRTLVLALPPLGKTEPSARRLREIAAEVEARQVAQLKERTWPVRLMVQEPAPGRVIERSLNEELNVLSATLDNGVRVHVRPMPQKHDQVYVRITLAGGRVNETADNVGITEIAALPLETPATRALSSADIRRIMSTRRVRVAGRDTAGALELDVRGHRDDLADGMRLAHLLLTEAYIEPTAFERWRREASTREVNREGSVSAQLHDRVDALVTNHDPRFRPLQPDDVARLTREAGQAWLDGLLATAPIEVAVVGDIGHEEALRLAQKYLGSLPARPPIAGAYAEARAIQAAAAGPHEAIVRVNTATPKAMVYLGWRGADWADVRDWQMLDLADRVLTSRLLREVRHRHGLVYSIRARATSDTIFRGNGRFRISFVVDPARAQEAADLVQQVVDEFVRTGPTAEELATAREQASLSFRGGVRMSAFWLDVLADLEYMGGDLAWVQSYLDTVQRYTRDEVHEAVRRYLRAEHFVRVIGVPENLTLVQNENDESPRPPVASIE